MKKSKNIIVIVILMIVVIILCLNHKIGASDAPYLNITYSARNDWACLTFYRNGRYTMYDCDSEPTNYFFDDEHECTYKYFKKESRLEFDCKIEPNPDGKNSIKVLEWDKKHIKFLYYGQAKTFYSRYK